MPRWQAPMTPAHLTCRSRYCVAMSAPIAARQSADPHRHLSVHWRAACGGAGDPADVGIIHAQKADARGNVLLERHHRRTETGSAGAQRSLVTSRGSGRLRTALEQRRDTAELDRERDCGSAKGAHPSYAHGYYARDNGFYIAWDKIARDRDSFLDWMRVNVLQQPASAVVRA